jgi:hypothetical protein
LAHVHTPLTNVHAPAAKKFGLGAILADGLEIDSGFDFTGGGLLTVVVVVGATVVGVTTVVGGGVVVVGLAEPVELDRDFWVEVDATTRACREIAALALW